MSRRSTTLNLLDLESRLVPSSYSAADQSTSIIITQVGDPTPLPVDPSTPEEAIFTITVLPRSCNCAACRAAIPEQDTAVSQPAPTTPTVVVPARESATPTVEAASMPEPTPATVALPEPVASPLSLALPTSVSSSVSVAPLESVAPTTLSVTTPTQSDLQHWSDDTTRLSRFASPAASTIGEPDRITVPQGGDTNGQQPAVPGSVWADPFASATPALTVDMI